MEWTEEKDRLLANEILLMEPFKFKAGSKERGSVWTQIASNLNGHPGFVVTQRSVRDRFSLLEKKAKKRRRDIEKASGISPEDTELDLALEEIIEKWEAADVALQAEDQTKTKKIIKDKETAVEMRNMSMETLGATMKRKAESEDSEQKCKKQRRSGNDTVQFLRDYSEKEFQLKREELQSKKEEQSVLLQQQQQQQQMFSMLQQQQQQHNQQQQHHQHQVQQQMQQMQQMFLESQRQQAQLMASLFEKLMDHK